MNDPKPWYQSKTVVTNLTIAVLTGLITGLEVIYGAGPQLTWGTVIGGLIACLNVWMRFTTSQPITINTQSTQVGGTQFTGAAQVGIAAGSVGAVTEASGGAAPFPPPGSDSGVGTV